MEVDICVNGKDEENPRFSQYPYFVIFPSHGFHHNCQAYTVRIQLIKMPASLKFVTHLSPKVQRLHLKIRNIC